MYSVELTNLRLRCHTMVIANPPNILLCLGDFGFQIRILTLNTAVMESTSHEQKLEVDSFDW
jgi:hypothetical protein